MLMEIINNKEYSRDFLLLRKAFEYGREKCLDEIINSELTGRGGAGFPTGKKWNFVKGKEDIVLICNADEGEPGTFKDRYIMENNSLFLLESLLISSFIINAKSAYIYIRGEYIDSINEFNSAIEEAKNILEWFSKEVIEGYELNVVVGAGAYICGDETSLINSIEGKRPASRLKPPYPADKGLFDKPTIVNNVETFCNVGIIMDIGSDEYKKHGVEGSRGTKLISLSGKVNNPGVYEIEQGKITVREIIENLGGGIVNNNKLKFVIPGGISTAILNQEELDIPYDRNSLAEYNTSTGSGAMIVVDDTVSALDIACSTADFFMHETCGTCFPCKEGNRQIYSILNSIRMGKGKEEYLDIIKEVTETTTCAARCGLGQSVGNLIVSSMDKFHTEYVDFINRG